MTDEHGRNATQAYRVRVGDVWYWVDPTVPRSAIETGDTVVIYPADDEGFLAVVLIPFEAADNQSADDSVALATLEGQHFRFPVAGIVAVHLAAVDDEED
jgi:hypothetical protein